MILAFSFGDVALIVAVVIVCDLAVAVLVGKRLERISAALEEPNAIMIVGAADELDDGGRVIVFHKDDPPPAGESVAEPPAGGDRKPIVGLE